MILHTLDIAVHKRDACHDELRERGPGKWLPVYRYYVVANGLRWHSRQRDNIGRNPFAWEESPGVIDWRSPRRRNAVWHFGARRAWAKASGVNQVCRRHRRGDDVQAVDENNNGTIYRKVLSDTEDRQGRHLALTGLPLGHGVVRGDLKAD
jgi:hypothetical protein